MKSTNLSLETAKLMYKSEDLAIKQFALDNYSKEELEEPNLPMKWEDIKEIDGYYIDTDSNIRYYKTLNNKEINKNIFPTKEYAEASLALAQLLQLRQAWIGDWQPDYNNSSNKFVIHVTKDTIGTDIMLYSQNLLSFPTFKLTHLFLETFRDLLEIAKPLL